MISIVTRRVIGIVLTVVAMTVAIFIAFLVVAGIARYEKDDGYCPDIPPGELEAKIVAFANEQHIYPDGAEFVGMPRYHAETYGWWAFDLSAPDGNYVATIDCHGRVTSFGKVQKLPRVPATPAR
ncbi:hypothetical protein [Burkholderia sp. AU45388]|uniref:hypothetical protein n=1 Tax=Burkholderia sp. AU45388 TaxID=3059206 RepID=UPI0026537ED1|nr:hypothetical protein [Burkholderia sp. AU45388]MDN7428386.1 hypothetical protein [Burkholderia sp. AU45388]